ncbi:hypothetical protein ACYSNM_04555 [Myroides sp. LJL116]
MKRIILLSMFLSYGLTQAQDTNIGVGIGTLLPDASAALHISSTNKGVIYPNISLSSRTDKAAISGGAPKVGLMIFNTTNDDTKDLTPGFYVWGEDKTVADTDKFRWIHIVTSAEIKKYISDNTSTYTLDVTAKIPDDNNEKTQIATLKDAAGLSQGSFTETLTALTGELVLTPTYYDSNSKQIRYLYERESGIKDTIFIGDDVIQSFEHIVNNDYVTNILKNLIKNSAGSVNISKDADDYVFSYTDASNQTQTFNLTTEIRAKQAYTSASAVAPTATTGSGLSIVTGKTGDTPFNFLETVTSLKREKNGATPVTYSYLNETGNADPVTIKPVSDLIEDVDIFFGDTNVINKVKNISTGSIASGWYNLADSKPATAVDQVVYNTSKAIIGSNQEKNHAQSTNIKLQVEGDVLISGKLITAHSMYADYVFEKYFGGHSTINDKYVFNDLAYVEEFVKAYNHLPGVTSISELSRSEDGGYYVDFSKLAIEQLEKIEELYLHTIDQQNQLESLKQNVQSMENRLLELERLMLEKNQ